MLSFKEYINEDKELLLEGGGFGHLDNVWERHDFTFAKLKNIIDDSLSGNLEMTRLKTDGQNIMFTYKDRQLLFARNKSHIKNFAKNALTGNELKEKFSGRGGLSVAFASTVEDLNTAIQQLNEKDLQKIFKEGQRFMSMEIMFTESENVISYGNNQLRLQNTFEYDFDGNIIDRDERAGSKLFKLIKDARANKQTTFEIFELKNVTLPKIPDFDKKSKQFKSELIKIQRKYNLTDNSTLEDLAKEHVKKILEDKDLPFNEKLLDRFVLGLKGQYKISDIKKDFSKEDAESLTSFEKNELNDVIKDAIDPVETIFMKLGAIVLDQISDFMVLNPDKSVQKIKAQIDNVVKLAKKSDDPKIRKKLQTQLDRFEKVDNKIFPEEGITFFHEDDFLKLTGSFGPINQLIGLLWEM